jgi:hypothetical protein
MYICTCIGSGGLLRDLVWAVRDDGEGVVGAEVPPKKKSQKKKEYSIYIEGHRKTCS